MIDLTHFALELRSDLPEIDLHNTTDIQEALEQLERDLFVYQNHGHDACRVIHGIGTGRLKKSVVRALEKNPLVAHLYPGEDGGSLFVVF